MGDLSMKNNIPILEIEGINKHYSKNVLVDCSLKCFKGDYIAIVGASGSGKSTLLNILSLLDEPNSGNIRIYGKTVVNDFKRFNFRRNNIGFIYQNFNLIENLLVSENIRLIDNFYEREIDNTYYNSIIEKLGLKETLNQECSTLSGGEKQRVAIARALIHKPEIIIADEPTGNLDEENSDIIFNILKEMNSNLKISIILVTHDLDRIKDANRRYKLYDGGLYECD